MALKPSIRVIAGYYQAGTLDELRRKGKMSESEYLRHVKNVQKYVAQHCENTKDSSNPCYASRHD